MILKFSTKLVIVSVSIFDTVLQYMVDMDNTVKYTLNRVNIQSVPYFVTNFKMSFVQAVYCYLYTVTISQIFPKCLKRFLIILLFLAVGFRDLCYNVQQDN